MALQTRLVILGLLLLATVGEAAGDAVVRMGLAQSTLTAKALYLAGGAVLLFGYGLTLNLAPIAFDKVVGLYLAMLFVVWQVVSFAMFKTTPSAPVLVGGSLIVVGGLIVAFWQPAEPVA